MIKVNKKGNKKPINQSFKIDSFIENPNQTIKFFWNHRSGLSENRAHCYV